jgi:hypothetical protein
MGLKLVPKFVYETFVGEVWETAGNTLGFPLYLSFLCRTGRREGRNKKWYNLGLFADPQPPTSSRANNRQLDQNFEKLSAIWICRTVCNFYTN